MSYMKASAAEVFGRHSTVLLASRVFTCERGERHNFLARGWMNSNRVVKVGLGGWKAKRSQQTFP
jgi:hypothetical protein